MSSSLYDLYEQSVLDLAGTLVINHRMIGETINRDLIANGYLVDNYAPSTWRYYLNLAGQYHDADHDYLSTVNADGSPWVLVTVAGASGPYQTQLTYDLINGASADPAIAHEYAYGTRSYNALLNKYPDAENLIRGILYPVDINISTVVEDGAILYMGGYYRQLINGNVKTPNFIKGTSPITAPLNMIEDNEITLIPKLETWIKNLDFRWLLRDYIEWNDYYLSMILAIIYGVSIGQILKIRISHIKTSEVHSYHVKEEFDSNGRLAKWVDAIGKAEVMYIYRNLDALVDLRGREDTFWRLVDNVLTPSRIPVAGYQTEQNTVGFENHRPLARLRKIPLNGRVPGSGSNLKLTKEMLDLELGCAPENYYDEDNQAIDIATNISRSNRDTMLTKVVESNVVQVGDFCPITFPELLASMWVFNAVTNRYNGLIYLPDPVSGESVVLTPLSALILANYCFVRGFCDKTPTAIPDFMVRITPMSSAYTPAGFEPKPNALALYNHFQGEYPMDMIVKMIGTVEPLSAYTNTAMFYKDVKKQYAELARRTRVYSNVIDSMQRAVGENVNSKLYWTNKRLTQTAVTGNYSTFLSGIGINVQGLSNATFRDLFEQLVKLATGNTSDSLSQLAALQAATIGILKHFTDYTVQYITSIIGENMPGLNIPQPRSSLTFFDQSFIYTNPIPRLCPLGEVHDVILNADIGLKAPSMSIIIDETSSHQSFNLERGGLIVEKLSQTNRYGVNRGSLGISIEIIEE